MSKFDELKKLAEAATPGPWMRLFGERTVYDRMEDGCRGNAIVRADGPVANNLDFIAAANPAATLELLAIRAQLVEALKESRRAIGDHYAPNDCYTTGPMTGDVFRDFIQCPACSAIAMHDASLAAAGAQP